MTAEMAKIEKKITIRAPRSRVWRALTTAEEFAKWFAAEVRGSFAVGKRVEMAATHPCDGHDPDFYVIIERMEPEHTFVWRWHPGSAKPGEDQATEVEFHLEEVPEGTLLTVTETGFDGISLARRAKAFDENAQGWEEQLESLRRYAAQTN